MTKYIFVTGGVVSSLGKGVAAASVGAILEARGFSVTLMKFDPYVNVDPGTMSPYQHGEVFVTDDGAETDLDLGHYERFTHTTTSKLHNYTTGKIYESVIWSSSGCRCCWSRCSRLPAAPAAWWMPPSVMGDMPPPSYRPAPKCLGSIETRRPSQSVAADWESPGCGTFRPRTPPPRRLPRSLSSAPTSSW